jgi:GH18 family chitinase
MATWKKIKKINMRLLNKAIFLVCLTPHFLHGNTKALGQENATWAKSLYFRGFDPTTKEKLNDKMLIDFAEELKRNRIRFAYIFAGPYQNDGHLPLFAYSETARKSIMLIKKIYPEIKILPWLGGVQDRTVHLENKAWLSNSIADSLKIIKTMPVDGIHIDIEYVIFPHANASTSNIPEYGKNWILFHKMLRDALPGAFISTVVVSTAKDTNPWKLKLSLDAIDKVSTLVNQMSFMYYETNLHEITTYKNNLSDQIQQIQALKNKQGAKSPQYLIGIGTFKTQIALQAYRDMRFENISATLSLLKKLLSEVSPARQLVDGIAVYCEWLTTEEDWAHIRSLWTEARN